MEDEDDGRSPAESTIPNGRLTIKAQSVTEATPPQRTLTLPVQNQQQQEQQHQYPRMVTGGGREDCWSEGATATLIDAWGERYLELSRGNLKQKHWKEVADAVTSREDHTKTPKTDVQCKNRMDTLKKKYKVEKTKILSGDGPSKWVFFQKLEDLIGPSQKNVGGTSQVRPPGSSSKFPVVVPVAGMRSFNQFQQRHVPVEMGSGNSNSLKSEASWESSDGLPPPTANAKRRRVKSDQDRSRNGDGNGAIRELTQAILKFGELYERTERSKLQQITELEKQRMGLTKELESQRMQFFMKTQLELTQLKQGKFGNGN